jgi:hypothetical protein
MPLAAREAAIGSVTNAHERRDQRDRYQPDTYNTSDRPPVLRGSSYAANLCKADVRWVLSKGFVMKMTRAATTRRRAWVCPTLR